MEAPLPGVSCRTPSCLAPTCTHCTTCTPSPSSAPAYAMASPWPPGLRKTLSQCLYPISLPCNTLLAELTGPVNMYHHGRVISIHVCLHTVTLPPCHTAALTCIPSTESTAFGESSSNICNRPQHGPSPCGGQKLGMIDSDTSAGV